MLFEKNRHLEVVEKYYNSNGKIDLRVSEMK